MTMKQFRDATKRLSDDTLVFIDFGDGQIVKDGVRQVGTLSVRFIVATDDDDPDFDGLEDEQVILE